MLFYSLQKLTLTRRVLIMSLAAGLVILLALDIYVRRQVRDDFVKQLTRQLEIQANEGRMRFDNYVKGHYRLARIIGGQATFIDYISTHDFSGHELRESSQPPSWLPPLSILRQLTRVDFFIIVDDKGKSRDFYCSCQQGLPVELQTFDATTLQASQNENFITILDGVSYILSSVAIKRDATNAYLLLATEINDRLLTTLHPPYQTGSQILALVTGYNPSILVSSDKILIPPGTEVSTLTKDFFYSGAKIFNYEYADMLITYAHFLPKGEIDSLIAPILRRERLQLFLVATLFTLFFLSVMLWISHRIAVITSEVAKFSQESLGGGAKVIATGGNELVVLRNHFRLLADEVRSTNRQQALFLQTVLDAMPAPVFYKNIKGLYQGCNQAFADYLGKPRNAIVDHSVYDVAPPELADIYFKADNDLIKNGGHQVYETRMLYADNTEHDIMFHKATFADNSGKIAGLVGIMVDITERNRAENARKKIEAKLLQAQKMESIGTMAGGIAHDFNNILAAIIGYTELALLETPEDSPLRPHLEIVFNSGNRARDLIKQILTFSRQGEHEKKPLSMAPILKEAMKMLRASIPSTIEFKQEINKNCGLINGDPVQIHQVIMNLCTNAYHAMRQNGGILAVSLTPLVLTEKETVNQPELYPGRWQCLEISDSGVGMKPEIVDRIFEPYFTTKGKGEGTGLGLAVVHGIIMEHQGHISVHSKVGVGGVGTTFQLYFPELQQDANMVGLDKELELLQAGSGHILVVDDEKPILGMLSGILKAAGYEVTSCSDPLEALALFTAKPDNYDLMITDMTMPGMTGFDLSQRIIGIQPEPAMPIILCTGYSELISKEKALQAGIQRYIMKPVSGHKLVAIVYELLGEKKSLS